MAFLNQDRTSSIQNDRLNLKQTPADIWEYSDVNSDSTPTLSLKETWKLEDYYEKTEIVTRTSLVEDTSKTISASDIRTILIANHNDCNTITLTAGTGVNELNLIEVYNLSGGAVSVTDGSVTYTLKDDQKCIFYFSDSVLCRGSRYSLSGIIDPRDQMNGSIGASNVTEQTVYNALVVFLPETNDELKLTGGLGTTVSGPFAWGKKTDASTITIYRIGGTGAYAATTYKSDGSGSAGTINTACAW